jgi:hypothetical protein
MKILEKAKKKYWYDHSFDKSQNHWDAHVELSIFAEGWKQALEWALTQDTDLNSTELAYAINKELNENY